NPKTWRRTRNQSLKQRFETCSRATSLRNIRDAQNDRPFLFQRERVVPGHAKPTCNEIKPRFRCDGWMNATAHRTNAPIESLRSRLKHTDQRAQKAIWLFFLSLID